MFETSRSLLSPNYSAADRGVTKWGKTLGDPVVRTRLEYEQRPPAANRANGAGQCHPFRPLHVELNHRDLPLRRKGFVKGHDANFDLLLFRAIRGMPTSLLQPPNATPPSAIRIRSTPPWPQRAAWVNFTLDSLLIRQVRQAAW
jgi:hypothetical protein